MIEYLPFLLGGVWFTIKATFFALLLGLALSALFSFMLLSAPRTITLPLSIGITAMRGLPELLVVLMTYYGLGYIIGVLILGQGFYDLGALVSGVIALGLCFASYATEIWRGAFLAVPKEETEAALAYGMRPLQIFWRIRLPRAVGYALPGLGNLLLVLIKDTSILSVIEVAELMRRTRIVIGITHLPFTYYIVAATGYLFLTVVVIFLIRHLKTRLLHWQGQHAV
jgi:putative lysine/arginine/ornithine/histidine/octopine transport system permease protein